jgi:cell division protein FtsW
MRKKRVIDFSRVDYLLLESVLFLVVLGAAIVYSASSYRAEQLSGDSATYFKNQLFRIGLGLVLMFIVASIDYHKWLGFAPLLYVFALFFLLLVFIGPPIAPVIKGARRWIQFGPIQFQPSDFARYAMIMILARALHKQRETLDDLWGGYLRMLVLIMAVVIPVALEPDLGTALNITVIGFLMLFFAEVKISYLLATGLTFTTVGFTAMMAKGYQLRRMLDFIDHFFHQGELGWQVKQSLISLAQGGFFGQGIGASRQKYYFLPEAHKDFIFSIIGEELGFFGTFAVAVLFFIIVYRGIKIAQQAPDGYGRLLAGGITVCIGGYALINMAVCVAIVPTTGIPMPFISYGGTALISHMVAIGLLINISSQGSVSFANAPGWRTYNKRLKRPAFNLTNKRIY